MAAIAAVALSAMTVAAQDSATASSTAVSATASPTTPSLSFGVPDVLKLSDAKVSEDTIVSFVQNSSRNYGALSAAEIVYLHDQGVSERVVSAMLEKRKQWSEAGATAPAQTAAVASAPQYQQAPAPAPATHVQPAPPSTVYVVPSTPTSVDYGYYPYYGDYGCGFPGLSFSFGYYGGYRGGYYHGSGYHGGGHHSGGGYHGSGGSHGGGGHAGGGRHR